MAFKDFVNLGIGFMTCRLCNEECIVICFSKLVEYILFNYLHLQCIMMKFVLCVPGSE